MKIVPVLLSGGVGTRLWPLSRAARPKQLQTLMGEQSMLQATMLRLSGIEGLAPPIVVCGGSHSLLVSSQLRQIGVHAQLIIAEPGGRNTGPAVTAAALTAAPDAVLLVLPADHVITDTAQFRARLSLAVAAAQEGFLVTFGVTPTRPETGYGYIEAAAEGPEPMPVRRFVEKPDAETAAGFIARGGFYWNSGMFVFRADAILAEMRVHAPRVLDAVQESMRDAVEISSISTPGDRFLASPAISIDQAVMEHTDKAKVVALDAGWSDVGSWQSLYEVSPKDAELNVVVGSGAVLVDTRGSYVRTSGRTLAVVGLDDVVVVETPDAVLVMRRDRAQDVRAVVDRLDPDLR